MLALLVTGVWVNRRQSERHEARSDWEESLVTEEQYRVAFGRRVRSRSTARFKQNRGSRCIATFPYLIEVGYWLAIYLLCAPCTS